MRILHVESSNGWGGQEIRILREAKGLRERGCEIVLAIVSGGKLVQRARDEGFIVYEMAMDKKHAFSMLSQLIKIIRYHKIDVVNTHSSFDAWVGGIAARLTGRKVVRTRHVSTHINGGLNGKLLYKWLSDYTVTTSEYTADMVRKFSLNCRSIPTGMDGSELHVNKNDVENFRLKHAIAPTDFLVGTACILRSWKGLYTLVEAAKLLEDRMNIKWIIVGSGPMEQLIRDKCRELKIKQPVIFAGFVEAPQVAIAAMDLFMLLSTANEGVSQASLQAAFLKKPLITTRVGGLPEVCMDGNTGFLVDNHAPQQVADKVLQLSNDAKLREILGTNAHNLVKDKFSFDSTLDQMQDVFSRIGLTRNQSLQ